MAGFTGDLTRFREVAWRVFAEELRASNLAFRENEDQYAPLYLLTPTGAKCNRVFIVGTLTEKDDIGGDTEYWRGRIVDPTGSILIYAGQYQPEAAQALANIEPPAFVSIVGKPKLYQTEDGNIIISVRVEAIHKADKAARDQWILDTARRTSERLNEIQSIASLSASGDSSTADKTADKTHAASPSPDASKALEHYHTDTAHYRQMVVRALTSLKEDLSQQGSSPEATMTEAKAETEETKPKPASSVTTAERPKTKTEAKKAKPKASKESLDAWPSTDSEEVEEVSIYKRPPSGSKGEV